VVRSFGLGLAISKLGCRALGSSGVGGMIRWCGLSRGTFTIGALRLNARGSCCARSGLTLFAAGSQPRLG
jgi:hypothetical protein